MKIVNLQQRSDEWHEWRKGGISASEVPTIIGKSPYQTPWRLWAEKTGRVPRPDLSKNPHVQRGVRLEDTVRRRYEDAHPGEILLPVCASHDTEDWMRCSLDGLTGNSEPVEMKVPTLGRFIEVVEQGEKAPVFDLYWPQVQAQIFVSDAKQATICFYTPDSEDLPEGQDNYLEIVIPRDDDFIQNTMLPKCREFWEWVQNEKEPPKDPERDIFVPEPAVYAAWESLAQKRRVLEAEKKRLEDKLKALKKDMGANEKELVAMMGEFVRADAAGIRVTRSNVQGSVDYKKIVEKLLPDLDPAELEAARRPGRTQNRITVDHDMKVSNDRDAKAKYAAAIAKAAEAEADTGYIEW